jgi:hypothetical protein
VVRARVRGSSEGHINEEMRAVFGLAARRPVNGCVRRFLIHMGSKVGVWHFVPSDRYLY